MPSIGGGDKRESPPYALSNGRWADDLASVLINTRRPCLFEIGLTWKVVY